MQKSKQLRDCISNVHLSGTGRSSLPCSLPGVFHNQVAAGTWRSRQSSAASQMTHCLLQCHWTCAPCKTSEEPQKVQSHWLSQYELLLTSQASLKLQTWSGHLLWAGGHIGFPDISPARLEVKSSFSKVKSFWWTVSASFYITQLHVELNKKDMLTINLHEENKQSLLS